MDDASENPVLNAYFDAVSCFENFESLFHDIDKQSINSDTIMHQLNICIQKIRDVIVLEGNEGPYTAALIQLHNQLEKEYFQLQNKVFNHLVSSNTTIVNNITTPDAAKLYSESPKVTKPLESDNCKRRNTEQRFAEAVERTKTVPTVNGFKDIAGLHDVKKILKMLVIIPKQQPQLYLGRMCNSCLLFGPPGTGKTRLVHALAAEANCSLYSVSSSDILSSYVGDTEKMTKAIFQHMKALKQPSILFVDEIDGLCRRRSDDEKEYSRRFKTELLCQMSNISTPNSNLFVICATNCPWDLDPAFLRRFERRIYIPLPKREERFEVLQYYMQNTPLMNAFNNWEPLLTQTEGFSFSEVADLVSQAFLVPVSELMDAKIWRLTPEGYYEPAIGSMDFTACIWCDLSELPPGMAKARPLTMNDLMVALKDITRTVSKTDIQKYVDFCSNYN